MAGTVFIHISSKRNHDISLSLTYRQNRGKLRDDPADRPLAVNSK